MLDQKKFIDKYKIEEEFIKSGLEWNTLEKIYDDYTGRENELKLHCKEVEELIGENITVPIHSIRCRAKEPDHLIEKIIRKRGKEQSRKYVGITVDNYRDIVRDLIGVRILVLSKEEWEGIFQWVKHQFTESKDKDIFLAEHPVAYTRYGDRDIFGDKIHKEHSNKGYRSQHYIIKYKDYFFEIQVRTLAEEVFGEFDHKVKYPYRSENKFLRRYTNSISQLLDSVDEIISTCFQLGEQGWENCNHFYEEDQYIDWQHISQHTKEKRHTENVYEGKEEKLEIASYANTILLRRGK